LAGKSRNTQRRVVDDADDRWSKMNDKESILAKMNFSCQRSRENGRKKGEKMQKRTKVFLEFWGKGW
jgi:hypothetical protein